MSEVTVKQLAEVLGISLEQLMDQLSGAGISIKSADDTISNEDKRQLLAYLRSAHGKESKDETPKKKVVLKRKSTGTLKISSGTGVRAKTKTVNIEVRKKRIVNKLNKDEMDEIARDRQEALKALEERKKQLAAEETKRIEEEKLRKQEEEEARKAEESIKQQEQEEELVGVEETELEEVEEENDASSDTEEELTEEEQAKAKELQEIEDQVQRQVMAAVEKKKRKGKPQERQACEEKR